MFNFRTGEDNKWKDPQLVKKFKTGKNEKGIGSLYSYRRRDLVILPSEKEKSIQIYDSKEGEEVKEIDIGEEPSILAANLHGEVFAFAGESGTQIHVHKLSDGSLFKSLTRGSKAKEITGIEFDQYCYRIAVCSKGDTIHVFSLGSELATNGKTPEEMKTSLMSIDSSATDKSIPADLLESRANAGTGFFGYFSSSEKSYLKVYIYSPEKSISIVKNKLCILTKEGQVYSIDIQSQGAYYDTSPEVTKIDIVSNEEAEGE